MPEVRGGINKDLEFQENTACWSSAEGDIRRDRLGARLGFLGKKDGRGGWSHQLQ